MKQAAVISERNPALRSRTTGGRRFPRGQLGEEASLLVQLSSDRGAARPPRTRALSLYPASCQEIDVALAAAHAPRGQGGAGRGGSPSASGRGRATQPPGATPSAQGGSARPRAARDPRLPSLRGLARALPPTPPPPPSSPLEPAAPCLRLQKGSWRPKPDTRPPVLTGLHFVSGRRAGAGQDRGSPGPGPGRCARAQVSAGGSGSQVSGTRASDPPRRGHVATSGVAASARAKPSCTTQNSNVGSFR